MKQNFNPDNKQEVVSRIKKVLIKIAIIVLCIFAVVVLGFGIIIYRGLHPKVTQTSAEESIEEAHEDTDVINQDDGEKEYIDTPFYDEKATYAAKPIGIPIMLSDNAYRTLSESLKQQAPFNFAEYYALEETLDLYASTPVEKSKETTLLTNGLWELDTFNHLNYTEISSLEHAKEFIRWYDETQKAILTAIAESSKLDPNEMQALYAEYYLQLKSESDEVRNNCDLSGMNDYMKNYILSVRRSYATSNYSRIHDVAKWEANE